MKALLIIAGVLVMAGAVAGLTRGGARARLARLPYLATGLAARLVPAGQREDLRAEWRSEVWAIMEEAEAMPLTRMVRAMRFALGMMGRGRAVARELDGTAGQRRGQLAGLLARAARALASRPGGRGAGGRGLTISMPGGGIVVIGRAGLAASVALTAVAAAITGSVLARSGAGLSGSGAEWTTQGGDLVLHTTGPIVADGTVYFATDSTGLRALDAATGHLRWSHTPSAISFIAVAGGTVYALDNKRSGSSLEALDAATGKLRWAYSPAGLSSDYEAVSGGTVYAEAGASGGQWMLRALDAATGQLRWSYPIAAPRAPVNFPPVADGGTVYAYAKDHALLALDSATGKPRWAYPMGGIIPDLATVDGGTVYVGGTDHMLRALDTATGKPRWVRVIEGGLPWPILVAGGTVYTDGDQHTVNALDAATGKPRWAYAYGEGTVFIPAVAGGNTFAISVISNGHSMLRALDTVTGSVRWSYPVSTSLLTEDTVGVAGGTVYMARADHLVWALDAATGKPRWTYNTLGADRHLIAGWRLSEIGAPGATAYVFTHSGTLSALRVVP